MTRLDLLNKLANIQVLLEIAKQDEYIRKARDILQQLNEKLEELDIEIK